MKRTLAIAMLVSAGTASPALAQYTPKVLATFNDSNGFCSLGSLIFDGSGNLYGTTMEGGILSLNNGIGAGTVFEIAAGSGSVTTLATFNGANGNEPQGGLLADASGNMYGTTYVGGGYGSVFEISAGALAFTDILNIPGEDGMPFSPSGTLIADASGNMYGVSSSGGGANNSGTVYKIAANTHTLSTVASLDQYAANGGLEPSGNLAVDASGNLYGTTTIGGGTESDGTVFEVAGGENPNGAHTVTTLASFSYNSATGRWPNGLTPQGGVIADASGNLYGTTTAGGPGNYGTVFEVAAGTDQLTTLVAFNNSNGMSPSDGGLIADASGNLYGTTYGSVFEITAGTHQLITLATLNGTNPIGYVPSGGLVADAYGNLYGTTTAGGPDDYGTVFELSPATPPPSLVVSGFIPSGITNVGAAVPGGALSTTGSNGSYAPVSYHLPSATSSGYFQFGGFQEGDTGGVLLKFTDLSTGLDPANDPAVLADIENYLAACEGTAFTVLGASQNGFGAFDVELSFAANAADPYLTFDFLNFSDSSVSAGDLAVTDIGLVPEPASASLLAIGALPLLRRTRKNK